MRRRNLDLNRRGSSACSQKAKGECSQRGAEDGEEIQRQWSACTQQPPYLILLQHLHGAALVLRLHAGAYIRPLYQLNLSRVCH